MDVETSQAIETLSLHVDRLDVQMTIGIAAVRGATSAEFANMRTRSPQRACLTERR